MPVRVQKKTLFKRQDGVLGASETQYYHSTEVQRQGILAAVW